jgi:hypothetical protein
MIGNLIPDQSIDRYSDTQGGAGLGSSVHQQEPSQTELGLFGLENEASPLPGETIAQLEARSTTPTARFDHSSRDPFRISRSPAGTFDSAI